MKRFSQLLFVLFNFSNENIRCNVCYAIADEEDDDAEGEVEGEDEEEDA